MLQVDFCFASQVNQMLGRQMKNRGKNDLPQTTSWVSSCNFCHLLLRILVKAEIANRDNKDNHSALLLSKVAFPKILLDHGSCSSIDRYCPLGTSIWG